MSSKREKFYTLCKKLWAAGSAAALATAFFISGSPFTPVAHAQGPWNGDYTIYKHEDTSSDFTLDVNITPQPPGNKLVNLAMIDAKNLTVNGKTIDADKVYLDASSSLSVTNNSNINAVSGYLYASDALSINNSKVTQTYTGFLDGSTLTIENQSQIKQGLGGRITGQTWAKINNATIQQGTGGLIEAVLKDLTIENNAKVTQGEDGKIIAREAVTINGNGTAVRQGNGSVVESTTSTVSITGGAKLFQGNNSGVRTAAGRGITVTNGEVSQGLGGEVFAGGALNISGGSLIDQLQGTIKSGAGYGITINNSRIAQGDSSHLISGGTLTLANNVIITQGDDGRIAGGNSSDVDVNGATIGQGDGSSLSSNRNLTSTNSTISQGANASVAVNGTLSATGGSMRQGSGGTISGNSVTFAGTDMSQGKDGSLLSNTTMSITGGALNQENNGRISGNTSVTLSGANVNQDKDGSITSGGPMTINNGTVINQEYGLSVITSTGDMTVNAATINQSVMMNGNGGINARLGSGGLLKIEGPSKITQGGGGRISGNAGVNIASGAVIIQGDGSAIETLAGNDIIIGGTVTQGTDSDIVTANGGKLALLKGARITQDDRGRIINADHATLALDGIILQQGDNSIMRTGGDLMIANSGTRVENIRLGSNSLLAADVITLDNAQVSVGTGSEIRLGYINARTDKEKEDANVQLTVTNGSLLWNRGGGMLSIGSEVGGINDVSAFNKISIGANSEILSSGLLTLNNDWIEIAATGKLTSTGIISLANGSKVYGNGSIITGQGLIVTGGSILSPGGNYGKDIGTLHVSGPLMITASGIVEIQTGANGNSDLIVVSHNVIKNEAGQVTYNYEDGDALIGGMLRMSGDINEETVYTILQAEGTIAGEFVFDDAFFVANQWIEEENGWQYLKVGSIQEKDTHFASRAKTFNQKAAGRMLDKIGTGGGWWDAKTHLNDLGQADFLRAMDIISGGVKANSLTLYRENPWRAAANQFSWNPCGQAILGDQNRFCPNLCQTRAAWATPYYTEADYRSDGNAGAYSVRSAGIMAGINKQIDPKTVLGVFFGYGRPELRQGWDNVDMDDFTIGLTMGGMVTSKLEMKAIIAGGFQNYSMKRFLGLPLNNSAILTSDYDGNTLFASIELARPIYLDAGAMIRPLVAFESENVWQQGFKERGESIYALEFNKAYNDRTFVRTGFDAEIGARSFTLLGRAFYSHQLGGAAFSQGDIRFATGGSGFERVRGIDLERNFTTLGAGGKFYLNPCKTLTIAGNYDATMSAKSTSHAIYASLTRTF